MPRLAQILYSCPRLKPERPPPKSPQRPAEWTSEVLTSGTSCPDCNRTVMLLTRIFPPPTPHGGRRAGSRVINLLVPRHVDAQRRNTEGRERSERPAPVLC